MTKVELLKNFAKGCIGNSQKYLNLIKEIGYENYLIEQLG